MVDGAWNTSPPRLAAALIGRRWAGAYSRAVNGAAFDDHLGDRQVTAVADAHVQVGAPHRREPDERFPRQLEFGSLAHLREPPGDIHVFRNQHYAFLWVTAADYAAHARQRSPKWDTVTVPAGEFRSLALPVRDS